MTSTLPASGLDRFPDQRVGAAVLEARHLSGIEILRRVISGELPRPGIAKSLNFWIAEVEEARAVFEGEPGIESTNPMGGVHGGWALTLIDSACGCAAQTLLPSGVGYATLETKGNMTRAITPNSGVYRCEATILAQGRTIMTSEARLTGPDGKLYAHGTSTLLIMRPQA